MGAVTLFLLQFFRDPERHPEGGDDTIVSPADGTVLSVAEAPEAPAGARRRLSIFMSVFNCHVNRAPVAGRLADYAYVRGRKEAAFADKASIENEQNRITLVAAAGSRHLQADRRGARAADRVLSAAWATSSSAASGSA